MPKIKPFLWFNDNAEEVANFYLSVFPDAKIVKEVRSKGVGPWPTGHIATIQIELQGQPMIFLNGGPSQKLDEAFSWTVECKDQAELDHYWDALLAGGGKEIACSWLKDRYGVCWQIVPENIAELIEHPKAMAAMMQMVKLDIAALEQAAKES